MAKMPLPNGLATSQESTEGKVPLFYILNRGRNTGGGQAYVYWRSPNVLDTTGIYYPSPNPGGVPFSQLTDILWAETLRT